jgi:uncharacterized protein YeaO (DUF488 family)
MRTKHDKLMDAVHDYHGATICTEIDNEILNDLFEEAGAKRIYTSNYSRCSNHPNAVSISASSPDYFTGKHIASLAPTWNMIKLYKIGMLSEKEYTRQYIELLEERHENPQAVYNSIPHRTIMLCYEKPGDFCHRRVLARWIEDALGVKIPEWTSDDEIKKEAVVDSLLEF